MSVGFNADSSCLPEMDVIEDVSADISPSMEELFRKRILSPTDFSASTTPPSLSSRAAASATPGSDDSQSPKKSPRVDQANELFSGLHVDIDAPSAEEQTVAVATATAAVPRKKRFGLTLEIPVIVLKPVVEKEKDKELQPYDPAIKFCMPRGTRASKNMVGVFQQAAQAVRACETEKDPKKVASMLPQKTSNSGVNGSYFIRGMNGRKFLVFKPKIGEYYNEVGDGGLFDTQQVRLKDGIEKGGSCARECVAYQLGASAGVPPTGEMTLRCGEVFTTSFGSPSYEEMRGSAQMFAIGRSLTDIPKRRPARIQRIAPRLTIEEQLKRVSVQDHHKLFLFDLRTVNTDRHKGNLFITPDDHFALIDNGCILAGFGDNLHYCWMDWAEFIPALHQPFDQQMVDELDWEKDAAVIKQNYPDFSDKGIETLRISEFILKAAIEIGLTPYEIGHFYEQSLNMEKWMVSPMNQLYGDIVRITQDRPQDFLPTLERALSIALQLFPEIKDEAQSKLGPGQKLDYNGVWLKAVAAATEQLQLDVE